MHYETKVVQWNEKGFFVSMLLAFLKEWKI